jgi:hypothetical protein
MLSLMLCSGAVLTVLYAAVTVLCDAVLQAAVTYLCDAVFYVAITVLCDAVRETCDVLARAQALL